MEQAKRSKNTPYFCPWCFEKFYVENQKEYVHKYRTKDGYQFFCGQYCLNAHKKFREKMKRYLG